MGCRQCNCIKEQENEILGGNNEQPQPNTLYNDTNEPAMAMAKTGLNISTRIDNFDEEAFMRNINDKTEDISNNPNVPHESLHTLNSVHDVANLSEEFDINFHDHAINVFHTINQVRCEPETFALRLQQILNKIEKGDDGIMYIALENCTYKFVHSEAEIKTAMTFLKKLSTDKLNEENIKTLLWSENIYQSCMDHLTYDEYDGNILIERINEKCSQKVRCLEIVQDGLMDPVILVLIMLIDQIELRESLFCKFFDFGAACCSVLNSELKVRTIIVLAIVTNRLSNKQNGRISLNHPAFDRLNYKHLIINQDFTFEDNLVTAKFKLSNGDVKIERIQI